MFPIYQVIYIQKLECQEEQSKNKNVIKAQYTNFFCHKKYKVVLD